MALRRTGTVFVSMLCSAVIVSTPALAGSFKDEPAAPAHPFTWSFNIGATTDYVFRGFSQNAEDPAVQGGLDIGYGIFYAGTWTSIVDFGDPPNAKAELDFYACI